MSDLGKPAFERFCLWGGDGLDKPENSGDVQALQLLGSTPRFKGKHEGGQIVPLEGSCQGSIAAAQFLEVNPRDWEEITKAHAANVSSATRRPQSHSDADEGHIHTTT
jgi:hypothetical protein